MKPLVDQILQKHIQDLEKINKQRKWWLYASSVVFTVIIFLIFGWEWLSGLDSRGLWWAIVSLMLIISINWWYWTMSVIRIIVEYQEEEYTLLKVLISDIKFLRKDIQKFHDQTIDILK